jgi:hypothetical protein
MSGFASGSCDFNAETNSASCIMKSDGCVGINSIRLTPTFSEDPMSWFLLAVAIMLEVAGTVCTKLSNGFTRLWPFIFLFVF